MTDSRPDALRQAVREITDQLSLAADGQVDFTVSTAASDPDAEKLVLLINGLLDSVSHILEREQAHARDLDRRVTERSALLKATWDTLIDGLIVIDEHGTIQDGNPAALRLLSTTNDIAGRNISDFMPEPHHSEHDEYLRHYMRTGEARIIGVGREVEVLREDGTRVPVHLAVSEMNVADTRQFVGLLRDISKERAQFNALQHERQFIERLFDAVPDIIYAFDTKLRFIRWNKSVLKILGMSNEEFADSLVPQHIAVRDWPRVLKAIHEVFTHGHAQVTARLKTPGGKLLPYEFVAARLSDANGNLLGLVGSGRNIAEREAHQFGLIEAHERAEEARSAAESASLAKSRFLASMSHELRTPLNAVIGYSELILEELEDGAPPENSRDDLLAIRDAGRHLLGLINDVLDLSRIEAGQMNSHPEDINPLDLVRTVVATSKPLIEHNGNRFTLDIEDNLPFLHTDGGKLRQCLLNLLSNAAKFTSNGVVTLRVARQDNDILWTVADTGIGMNEQEQGRIFEAFTQADTSIDRRYGGTGLGLTLTRQLIELLGGRIDVESIPGAGSIFRLRVPLNHNEEVSA